MRDKQTMACVFCVLFKTWMIETPMVLHAENIVSVPICWHVKVSISRVWCYTGEGGGG